MTNTKIDTTARKTNAVIYVRVSTREQGDSKLGLEAQEAACRQVCMYMGLTVLDVFTEVHSGKVAPLERHVFAKAHQRAKETNAKLVIAKLDRISRDFKDTVVYTHTPDNPELMIAENPAMQMLELRIRAVVAQQEREDISKRTKEALAAKSARGYKFGLESAKARKEKALEANRPSLVRAIELRQNGHSLTSIANVLKSEGFSNSAGKPWTVPLLSHHLRNTMIYAMEEN